MPTSDVRLLVLQSHLKEALSGLSLSDAVLAEVGGNLLNVLGLFDSCQDGCKPGCKSGCIDGCQNVSKP